MDKRWTVVGWMCVLILATTLGASAQPEAEPVRVLVVDETKTFTSTMLVAGLVGALRSFGTFEVGVALADVTTDYDDPLAGRSLADGEDPYDLIVILPRGLDDGSNGQIWIVSDGLSALPPSVAASLPVVSGIVEQVFGGLGESIDVSEDLWPCLLWAVYEVNGWMR